MRHLTAAWIGVTAAIAIAWPAASGGAAGAVTPALGAPFTLASAAARPFVNPVAGPSALGPDSTVWLSERAAHGGGFWILGRDADGSTLTPVQVRTSVLYWSEPVIAASRGAATFVWETQHGTQTQRSGVVTVDSLRCTIVRCGAIQTLARRRWRGAGYPSGANAPGPEPALAALGGHTVVVFERWSATDPQLVWTQSRGGGRFGALHVLAAGPAQPVLAQPVLVGSGERLFASWLATDLHTAGDVDLVHWSEWSPRSGFGRPRSFIAGEGVPGREFVSTADLVGTPIGTPAAIAWVEVDKGGGTAPLGRVWVARQSANGFRQRVAAVGGGASGLSLASGHGVLALAYTASYLADGFFNVDGPLKVTESAGGAPFAAPVTLDADAAANPQVAVDAQGGLLAGWEGIQREPGRDELSVQAAVAPAGGGFGPPVTVGAPSILGSPALDTNGQQFVVAWQSATASLLGTPVTP